MPEHRLALHSKVKYASDSLLTSTTDGRRSVGKSKSKAASTIRSAASAPRMGSRHNLLELVNVSMTRRLLVCMSAKKTKGGHAISPDNRIKQLRDAHADVTSRLARWEVHKRVTGEKVETIDSGHFPSGFGFFCCPERLYSREEEPELSQVYDQIMMLEDVGTKDQLLSFLDDFRLQRQALSTLNRHRGVLLSEVKAWIRQKRCMKLLKDFKPSFLAAIKESERFGDCYLGVGVQMEQLLHLKRQMSYLVKPSVQEHRNSKAKLLTAIEHKYSHGSRSLDSESTYGDVASRDLDWNFPAVDEILTCLHMTKPKSGMSTQLTVTKMERRVKALSASLQAQGQLVETFQAAVEGKRSELQALKQEEQKLREEMKQLCARLAGLQQKRLGKVHDMAKRWMKKRQANKNKNQSAEKEDVPWVNTSDDVDDGGGANNGRNCGEDKVPFAKHDPGKHDDGARTDYERNNNFDNDKTVIDDDDDDDEEDDENGDNHVEVMVDTIAAVNREDSIWATNLGPERQHVTAQRMEKIMEFNDSCMTELLMLEEVLLDKREEARQEMQAMADRERGVRSLLTSAHSFMEELERQIWLFPVTNASAKVVTVTSQAPPPHRCRFCLCDVSAQSPVTLDTREAAVRRGRRLSCCHPFIQTLTDCRFCLSSMHRTLERIVEEAEMDLQGSERKRLMSGGSKAQLGEFSSPDIATDRLIQADVSAVDVLPCVSVQGALARARTLASTLARLMSSAGKMQRNERRRRAAGRQQENLLQELEGQLLEVARILGFVALDLGRLRCQDKFLTKGRILKDCLCVNCRCYNSPFRDGLRKIQKFFPDENYSRKLDRLGLSKVVDKDGRKLKVASSSSLSGKHRPKRAKSETATSRGNDAEDGELEEDDQESRKQREKEALTYTLASLTQGFKAVTLPYRPDVRGGLRSILFFRKFLTTLRLPSLQRAPTSGAPPHGGRHLPGLGQRQGQGQSLATSAVASATSEAPDAGPAVCAVGEAVLHPLELTRRALLKALGQASLHNGLNSLDPHEVHNAGSRLQGFISFTPLPTDKGRGVEG